MSDLAAALLPIGAMFLLLGIASLIAEPPRRSRRPEPDDLESNVRVLTPDEAHFARFDVLRRTLDDEGEALPPGAA